jgi:catalase
VEQFLIYNEFQVLDEPARARLVDNIAGHLMNAECFIQDRQVANFTKVNEDFGRRLRKALDDKKKPVCTLAVFIALIN